MSVAGAAVLCAARAHADEGECVSARYKAAGQYAACEAKAAAKNFDDAAFLKCRQKYAAAWTKLGTKYPATSCVGARFVDNGLTITDNLTQLVWEKKTTAVGSGVDLLDRHDVDNQYKWSTAGGYADGTAFTDFLDDLNTTGFAGQHDWRLPTLFELQSIVATNALPCGVPPCVADPLFSITSGRYWSSTESQSFATPGVLIVFFDDANTIDSIDTPNYYVRAVRAGN